MLDFLWRRRFRFLRVLFFSFVFSLRVLCGCLLIFCWRGSGRRWRRPAIQPSDILLGCCGVRFAYPKQNAQRQNVRCRHDDDV